MQNNLLMTAGAGIVLGPVEYISRTVGANVSTGSIPSGAEAGDLIVCGGHDTAAIGAFSSPWTDHGASGNARCASFILDAESSLSYPATIYPVVSAFRNAVFGDVAFATGSGTDVAFPSMTVTQPNSAIFLSGMREPGTVGTLTYSIPGSSGIYYSASARQFGILINGVSSSFSGATVTMSNSGDWNCMTVLIESAGP
jgi:hypothetical protein